MKPVLLKTYVTLNGEERTPGEVVELDEKSAAALIAEGGAVDTAEEAAPAGSNDPTDEEKAAAEIEKQRKALDSQYNLDEGGAKPGIKEAAKAAGVDFPFDANKAAVIDAIVAQGKAVELIK